MTTDLMTEKIDKFSQKCECPIPLHNLNEEFYVFIWELPLTYADSIQELADKFHARYEDPNYKQYTPPKYRGIYRNPQNENWVIVSAFYIGETEDCGGTTSTMFDAIRNRLKQFSVFASARSIPCKMACITSGDNYREHCKYIKDSIEMLEIEYGETERDALIPIRQNLHRIVDYKPELKIVEGN